LTITVTVSPGLYAALTLSRSFTVSMVLPAMLTIMSPGFIPALSAPLPAVRRYIYTPQQVRNSWHYMLEISFLKYRLAAFPLHSRIFMSWSTMGHASLIGMANPGLRLRCSYFYRVDADDLSL
jgi:hypothetical protein